MSNHTYQYSQDPSNEVTRFSITAIKNELLFPDSKYIYYSIHGHFPIVFTAEASKEIEHMKNPDAQVGYFLGRSLDDKVFLGGYIKVKGSRGRYTFITASNLIDAFERARGYHNITNTECFLEITNIEHRCDKKLLFKILTDRLEPYERLDKVTAYKGARNTLEVTLKEYIDKLVKY
jgi:hypothetical protein